MIRHLLSDIVSRMAKTQIDHMIEQLLDKKVITELSATAKLKHEY